MRASLTIFFLAGLLAGLLSLTACDSALVVGYLATNLSDDSAEDSGSESSSSPAPGEDYAAREPDPEPEPEPEPVVQDGTAEHPWEVDFITELQSIATGFQNETLATPLSLEASLAAHYVLTADINAVFTRNSNWQMSIDDGGTPGDDSDDVVQRGFLPIRSFTGSFDGAGHIISGLYIDRQSTDEVGLFGKTRREAVLRNIALEDVDVSGDRRVGGLAGYNNGTVRDSYASGRVQGVARVGGLVGYNGLPGFDGGSIEGSFASGDVSSNGSSANSDTGGLVGRNDGTVSDSYATGTVSGENHTGGLVGYNSTGTVQGSDATGDVSGIDYVGGLVGANRRMVQDSYATGNISGESYVGGLAGYNNGTVQYSYATGNVSGEDSSGGLVGYNSATVQNSFATGNASGEVYVGGLVGWSLGTVRNSFATGTVSGEKNSGGLVGYNDNGTVQRAYCVDASGGSDCMGVGSSTDVSLVTVDDLRALTCETAVFDACEAWDFGGEDDLPVLNGTVGGLDPAGQRALIDTSDDGSGNAGS